MHEGCVLHRFRRPTDMKFCPQAGHFQSRDAKTNMTRLRGRALRGKRLYASAPQSHWQTTTMICSMRLDGSTACMTIEGSTDTEVFRAYVRQVLCPTLRPGDLVIMDNLSLVQWPLGTQTPDHACFRAGPHSLALPEAINKLNHMFFYLCRLIREGTV